MATRSAFIYANSQSAVSLPRLLAAVGRVGLTLEDPSSGKVLMLAWDGDQVAVGSSEIAGRIEHGEDTSFQMWFAKNHSLYVRAKASPDASVVELGMEGTSEQERITLRAALEAYFNALAGEGAAMGLIFDPIGLAEDYDWNRFFLMGETLNPAAFPFGLPDPLVLTRSLVGRVSGFLVHPYGESKLQLVQLLDMK
jgi:hypothetical protein